MDEDEREPLLFARGASALSHVSGGEDEAAVADKKTSSQCLRRRENQHGSVIGARVKFQRSKFTTWLSILHSSMFVTMGLLCITWAL